MGLLLHGTEHWLLHRGSASAYQKRMASWQQLSWRCFHRLCWRQVDVRLRCSTDGALLALAEDMYGPMSGQVSSAMPVV